jgi:hypothetical protein
VEAVHVELADKAVDFVVAEVSGEDDLLELVDILDDKLDSGWRPVGDFIELIVLGKKNSTFNISKVLAIKPATSAV